MLCELGETLPEIPTLAFFRVLNGPVGENVSKVLFSWLANAG